MDHQKQRTQSQPCLQSQLRVSPSWRLTSPKSRHPTSGGRCVQPGRSSPIIQVSCDLLSLSELILTYPCRPQPDGEASHSPTLSLCVCVCVYACVCTCVVVLGQIHARQVCYLLSPTPSPQCRILNGHQENRKGHVDGECNDFLWKKEVVNRKEKDFGKGWSWKWAQVKKQSQS